MTETVAAMVEAARLGAVDEIVPRSGGEMNTVFEVRRTAAEPVIVKLYPPESTWTQAKEIHVYGLLNGPLDGSTPRVLHAEQPGRFEHAYTVLTKLPGIPLSEAQPPDWQAIYEQLGRLLQAIHQIPQPAYGYLTDQVLDPVQTNDEYMRRQFRRKLEEFSQLGGDPMLGEQLTQYVDQRSGVFAANRAPVLCHNDFHEGNVLVDPITWRVTGFVDVENAIAADPLMDLAKTHAYSIRGDAAKLAGLLSGYGELPDDWRERIAIYQVFHWLELWDWFQHTGNTGPLDNLATSLTEAVGPSTSR